MNRTTLEEYCVQMTAKVVLTYPPLSCNQIDNGCYIFQDGRCQKLRDIAAAVAVKAKPTGAK